jgi:membrane-associated phospholipid phosphatase
MAYLRATDMNYSVWALNSQDYLLQNYIAGDTQHLSGISAFPSMHVSMAFIFLLLSSYYNKTVFTGFLVFFLFIMIGSVFLGWHYAVDGYFSILSTWFIWVLSGRVVRRFRLDEER